MVQLKLLQLSSLNAEQRVIIHCKKLDISASFTGFKRGIVLLDNKDSQNVELVRNGCSVSFQ